MSEAKSPGAIPFHDLANIFPLVEADEHAALKADIDATYLQEKILLLDGHILDGRNRYLALIELGAVKAEWSADDALRLVPDFFAQFEPLNGISPLELVRSKNLHRRHLTESQRAMIAHRFEGFTHGGERIGGGAGEGEADGGRKKSPEQDANLHLDTAPKTTRREAAESMNVSPRSVAHAAKVDSAGTEELKDAVMRGKVSVSAGADLSTLPPDEQRAAINSADPKVLGQVIKDVRAKKQAEKKTRRNQREEELAGKIRALPDARFGVIYADPEWQFKGYSEATGMDRAPEYPTSPLAELQARDVASIAADDCVLFLWATVPMLPEAFALADAWGFCRFDRDPVTGWLSLDKSATRYVSNWDWVKDKIITGFWGRGRHEHLLIFTKGEPVAPAMGTQPESVIDCPEFGESAVANAPAWKAGEHSAKPDLFAWWIETLFPNVPKIELNARQARPGWTAWGNEAPDADASDSDDAAVGRSAPVPGTPADPGDLAAAQSNAATGPAGDEQDGEAMLADAAHKWNLKALAGREGKLTRAEAAPALRSGREAGRTPQELADELGHPVGTIKTWMNREGLTDKTKLRRSKAELDAREVAE